MRWRLVIPMLVLGGCPTAAIAMVALVGCSVYELPPLSPRVGALPARLSEAHLYADASMTTVASDLRPYAPTFELWSDGASKRRWIRLPAGVQIDTSDVDAWVFPVGTELWKEFSVGGRRVETRLLTRVADDDDGWVGVAYVWNDAQTDAVATIDGLDDACGTTHDVPSSRACMTCHGGRASRVLGFSAVQLAHASVGAELSLDTLIAEGLLTRPPSAPIVVPGTPTEVAALGYLHANCGSCHNGARPAQAQYFRPHSPLDLWLTVASLDAVESTPTYRALGDLVVPGRPDDSALLQRFLRAPPFRRRMPPLATETRDESGVATLTTWIREMRAHTRR